MIDERLLPNDGDVQCYRESGYWLGGKVIPDAQLERLRSAMDEVYAGRFETGRAPNAGGWRDRGDPTEIRKTDNAHWANNAIRELAVNETIGAMAARLLGVDEIRLWHDQLLYKPGQGPQAASRAGNVGWHQDYGYWRCTSPDLITAWVAFDDVTLENGCMQLVPGSHQWGLLPHSDFFDTDLDGMRQRLEEHTGRKIETVAAALRAGEVSFHHCLTIHGSGPNATHRPRRLLVLHLMPGTARYIGGSPDDNHMNANLMRERGGKDGDPFAGELWPTLYVAG